MSLTQNLQNFLQGNSNYYLGLPDYQREQAELRAHLCKECLVNTKCQICRCKTPQMFFAPYKKDSKHRWAEFFSQEQWEALKNNIEDYYFFIKQLNDKRITSDNGICPDSPRNENPSESRYTAAD